MSGHLLSHSNSFGFEMGKDAAGCRAFNRNFIVGGVQKEANMAVSYNRLWKLLVDKKMSKADLRKASGVAPNTMTKLRRDEEVTLTVLGKICKTLNADYGDIMEYIDEEDT